MKNRLFTGILFIILGGLIAFGPQRIFPVCGVHTENQASAQSSGKTDEHKSMGTESQNVAQDADSTGERSSMAMTNNTVMKCHWTAQTEIGIGVLIVLIGVILFVFKSIQIRLGLSLALILIGLLALLIPTVLIGVCNSKNMTCRLLSQPALALLSSIVITTSSANVFYLYHIDRKGKSRT